ncbi:MAG: PadR family transcriptional regulator [Deltaproteobacteria bacterium]|nr:PadR family transcriptional regulator [Deltaproteobacteria bacterium]
MKPDVIDPGCPCTGSHARTLTAPWILLCLHNNPGTHGYEINRLVTGYLEGLEASLNLGGLYRQLKALEKRGMLTSHWDEGEAGPAKRVYSLTEKGRECLWRWMGTLSQQAALLERFFQEAGRRLPLPENCGPAVSPAQTGDQPDPAPGTGSLLGEE